MIGSTSAFYPKTCTGIVHFVLSGAAPSTCWIHIVSFGVSVNQGRRRSRPCDAACGGKGGKGCRDDLIGPVYTQAHQAVENRIGAFII